MKTPEGVGPNVANDSANVGVQAGIVHGDIHNYQLGPDASPEEKYRVGVAYLDAGMPAKACELIDEAVVEGHNNSEVRFHWLLARLSGRTRRQLTNEDRERLGNPPRAQESEQPDEWTDGLSMIMRLLSSLDEPDTDVEETFREFDRVGPVQRDKIRKHLDLFLKGPLQDKMWLRTVAQADPGRRARDRGERVWMFFEPDPAPPRATRPELLLPPLERKAYSIAAGVLAAVAIACIGVLVIRRAELAMVAAYAAGLGAACLTLWAGTERHVLSRLLADEDARFRTVGRRPSRAPRGGFTDAVHRMFKHYAVKYRPKEVEAAIWLEETAGIRRTLADEVADLYREKSTKERQVAWLARHLIRDVKARWRKGTLTDYRDRYRVPEHVTAAFVAGTAVLAVGGTWAVFGAVREHPLLAIPAVLALIFGSRIAIAAWLEDRLARRRFEAATVEYEREMTARTKEYRRWKKRLERRPTDLEMAEWLDCDHTMLMHSALNRYNLSPSEVIAQALLEAPGEGQKRARVAGGPWRYSGYRLMLFLLTEDGVRQLAADLTMASGKLDGVERMNYRFDAVASVHVKHNGNFVSALELALVNGTAIVADLPDTGPDGLDDEKLTSEVTLDAVGVAHTLHVLEGIAAEGRQWIQHEAQRGSDKLKSLSDALLGMV